MTSIVIIGGGFAGINLANRLANKKNISIILVDKNNYNFFPPLLYQVATGFLETSNISYPLRKLLRRKNIRFILGELKEVVSAENKVHLSNCELSYDYLVIATGSETNYFGMENVRKNALPMKNINDALELRNHLLLQLEKATLTTDAAERTKLLNIVVAGGGPIGVEVSGMLAEPRRNVAAKDYPELKGRTSHIYLVDSGAAVLKPMSGKSQTESCVALQKMGVEVKLNMHVKDYQDDIITFTNGETINTKTLVWAAGVTPSVFPGIPDGCYGKGKRLITDEFNKVVNMPNIYAIGDTCLQATDKRFPNGHPQVAQVAIQQGKNLAINLVSLIHGKKQKPFTYRNKGTVAVIGRNKAVADLSPSVHFKGFIAWSLWVLIHVLSLISYRNRITTLYNWVIAYFTKDQSLRMIIRPTPRKDTP